MRLQILFLFVFGILVFSSAALAQETLDKNIQSFVDAYNSFYEKSPEIFKTLVGNEVAKVSYKLSDGSTIIFGAKITEGKISSSSPEPYDSSTISISASQSTIERIAASSDQSKEFKNAWGSEIDIEGLNFASMIKVFILKLVKVFAFVFVPAPQKNIEATTTIPEATSTTLGTPANSETTTTFSAATNAGATTTGATTTTSARTTTTTFGNTTTTQANICAVPHGTGNYANGLCGVVSCVSGYYDCDGNGVNGCEATSPCATTTTFSGTTTTSGGTTTTAGATTSSSATTTTVAPTTTTAAPCPTTTTTQSPSTTMAHGYYYGDLAIDSSHIWVDLNCQGCGNSVKVITGVKNLGTDSAGGSINVFLTGASCPTNPQAIEFGNLAAASQHPDINFEDKTRYVNGGWVFDYNSLPDGLYTVKITVISSSDPSMGLPDVDNSNNVATKTFRIPCVSGSC